jgi:hypothetical protein
VFITYTHGYDQIPDDIRSACLQMASRGLAGPPPGVRQESIGSYSVTYDTGAASRLGATEIDLISRYRRRAYGVKIR